MFDIYIRDFQRGNDIVEKEELIQSIPSLSEGALRFVSSTVSCEMGNAESASFTIESGTPYYDAFLQMKTYIRIEYDGDIIFNGRVLTINNTFYGTRSITCEGPLAFLNDTAMEGTKESARKKRDAKTHMLEVLSNHNKMVKDPKRRIYLGEVPGKYSDDIGDNQKVATTEQKFGEDKWSESKSILEDLRSHFGGFYRIRYSLTKPTKAEGAVLKDGSESEYDTTPSIPTAYKTEGGQEVPTAGWYMYLDWFNHYFNKDTNTQTVEVGKNVIDISSSTEVSNIFTVVIPVSTRAVSSQDGHSSGSTENVYIDGKELPVPKICEKYSDNKLNRGYHSKEDYLQAINRYGRIIKTVSFDDADTKEKLYDKACEWILNNYQGEVTKFSVKAVDLHQIGENTNKICVGDRVNIKYIVGSENGTTNKVTIKRTCLSVTYDLLNPENNSYTFGIPANVLTKTYGIKRTNNQDNTPSNPGGDNDEPDPEETDWWYKLRDWLMNHMIWYSTGHPTAPLPYSDDDIHNAFMWGPNSPSVSNRSYLDYIYTTEDVAGLFNYLLWIPTKVGEQWDSCQDSEGHTNDALWHEKQYNALYYNGPNGEPTNAGMYAAKQFKAHHSKGTWSVGTRPVSLGGPLTLNAVLSNHIIEYVRDEYQFDLKYMSGIRMPSNVTLPSGAQVTTQVIVDQHGNEHVVDHSLYDPESGAQVFMRSDGVNIALLIDENGNYHYYFEDADGNPQEVSIKGLYSDLEAAGIKIETMEGQINIIGTEILPDLHNIHTELSQHGATITSITSDITTIGQRFSGEIANLLVQIAKMNQELADLDRTVTLISTDINIIGQRMDQSLADLIVRVAGLKSRLDGHDITITTITTDITVIGQRMDASYSDLIERLAVMGRTVTAITTDITLIGQRMDDSYSALITQLAAQGHTITAITTDVTLIGQRMDKNISRLTQAIAAQGHTITAITTDVTVIGQKMSANMAATIARLADMNRTVTAITSDIVIIGQKLNKSTSDFLERLAKLNVDMTVINTAINLFNANQLTPEIQQQIEDCAAHGLTVTAFGSDLVLFKGKLDAQNAEIRRIKSNYINTDNLSAKISSLQNVNVQALTSERGGVNVHSVSTTSFEMAGVDCYVPQGIRNIRIEPTANAGEYELQYQTFSSFDKEPPEWKVASTFRKAGAEFSAPTWTSDTTLAYQTRTITEEGNVQHILDELTVCIAPNGNPTVYAEDEDITNPDSDLAKKMNVPIKMEEVKEYGTSDEEHILRGTLTTVINASPIWNRGKNYAWDLARTKLSNPTTQNYNSATMYVGIPAANFNGSSSYAYSADIVKNGAHSYATIKNGSGTVIAAKQIEYEIGDLSVYADKDASVTKSGVTYTNNTYVGNDQGYHISIDEETGKATVAIVITGSVQVNGETKAFVADHYDYLKSVPTAIYEAGVNNCNVVGEWQKSNPNASYNNMYVVKKNGSQVTAFTISTHYTVHADRNKYLITARTGGQYGTIHSQTPTGTEVYDNGKTDGWTGCYNTVAYETSTTDVSANVVTIDPGGQICVKVLANSTKDATEATAKTSILVQATEGTQTVTLTGPSFATSGRNAGSTNTISASATGAGTNRLYTYLAAGAFNSANPPVAQVELKCSSVSAADARDNGTIVGRCNVTAPSQSFNLTGTWEKTDENYTNKNKITITKATSGGLPSLSYIVSSTAGISYDSTSHKYTATAQAKVDGASRGEPATVESGTEAYTAGHTAGWSDAYNSVNVSGYFPSTTPTTVPQSIYTAKVNSAESGSRINYQYYVTSDDDVAYIRYGGTSGAIVAKVTHNKYTNGQKAATVTGSWSGGTFTAKNASNANNKWTTALYDVAANDLDWGSSGSAGTLKIYANANGDESRTYTGKQLSIDGSTVFNRGADSVSVTAGWGKPSSTSAYSNQYTVKRNTTQIAQFTVVASYEAGTNNYIIKASLLDGTVIYQTTTNTAVYTNGQNSVGISTPSWSKSSGSANEDTFTFTTSTSTPIKTSRSYTIGAIVTGNVYSATTHKYTASAIGLFNGYQKGNIATLESGTEAYNDGYDAGHSMFISTSNSTSAADNKSAITIPYGSSQVVYPGFNKKGTGYQKGTGCTITAATAKLVNCDVVDIGEYDITYSTWLAPYGNDGWNNVHVNLPYSEPTFTSNGVYDPADYGVKAFKKVTVSIPLGSEANDKYCHVVDSGSYWIRAEQWAYPNGIQGWRDVKVDVNLTLGTEENRQYCHVVDPGHYWITAEEWAHPFGIQGWYDVRVDIDAGSGTDDGSNQNGWEKCFRIINNGYPDAIADTATNTSTFKFTVPKNSTFNSGSATKTYTIEYVVENISGNDVRCMRVIDPANKVVARKSINSEWSSEISDARQLGWEKCYDIINGGYPAAIDGTNINTSSIKFKVPKTRTYNSGSVTKTYTAEFVPQYQITGTTAKKDVISIKDGSGNVVARQDITSAISDRITSATQGVGIWANTHNPKGIDLAILQVANYQPTNVTNDNGGPVKLEKLYQMITGYRDSYVWFSVTVGLTNGRSFTKWYYVSTLSHEWTKT